MRSSHRHTYKSDRMSLYIQQGAWIGNLKEGLSTQECILGLLGSGSTWREWWTLEHYGRTLLTMALQKPEYKVVNL